MAIVNGTNGDDKINSAFGTTDNDDQVFGKKGDDKIQAGLGADQLNGGKGNDTADYRDSGEGVEIGLGGGTPGIGGTAEGDTLKKIENLYGSQHADTLYGNGGDNKIKGFGGDDGLKGGGGSDKLLGGSGNDILFGEDVLAESGDDDIIKGGSGNDIAFGQFGDDLIKGGKGNDQISGGLGDDTLYGNKGLDQFVFDSKLDKFNNVDLVMDFKSGVDKFVLYADIFTAIGPTLEASEFRLGKNAADADDYLIYHQKKGKLFYDADGNGAGDKVLFAKLDNKESLNFTDFEIVT